METVFLALLLLAILLCVATATWAGWRAAPYVPTRNKDIATIMATLNVGPRDYVIDLGAGDGRVVLAAASQGAHAVGFEISLLPFLVGLLRCRFSHYRHKVEWRYQDFFHADLSQASVVFAFLLPSSMARLRQKFERETRPGTWIISYAFQIKGWEPVKKIKLSPKNLPIWIYRTPEHI